PTLVRRAFWRKGPVAVTRPADADDAKRRAIDDEITASYRYTQFLGNDRRPMIEDVFLERNWNELPPELVWKQPIGEGWSSFAVYGSSAVTQEQRGDEELVTCYHLLTGEKLWEHVTDGRFTELMGGDGP